MNLFETTLPQNYSKDLFENFNYDLAADHTDKVFYILFNGASEILSTIKSKDRPAAVTFETINNTFVAGALVQLLVDEATNTEKWNLVWTFDESDLPDNTFRVTVKDAQTHPYFRAVAGDKYGMKFTDASCLITLLTDALVQLKKWLDENAAENKEVSIEIEGICQARVAVENGEKVFAIEPDGLVKKLIKDDASIEN